MHLFQYQNNELYAESVPVARIAEAVGTPCTSTATTRSCAITGHWIRPLAHIRTDLFFRKE